MIRRYRLIFIFSLALIIAGGIYLWKKKSRKADQIPKISLVENYPGEKYKRPSGSAVVVYRRNFDLESHLGIENASVIDSSKSLSGHFSCALNSEREFGVNITFPMDKIPGSAGLTDVVLTSAIWTDKHSQTQWVLEILDSSGNSVHWNGIDIPEGTFRWDTISLQFFIPEEFISLRNSLKFYPWNKKFSEIWIDNIGFVFNGIAAHESHTEKIFKQPNYFYDLESDTDLEWPASLSETFAKSGKRAMIVSGKDSYSTNITKRISEVTDDTLSKVTISTWLYPLKANPDLALVVHIKDENGTDIFWGARETRDMNLPVKVWTKISAEIRISPESRMLLKPEHKILIYIWNRSDNKVYADDFEIVFGGGSVRKGDFPHVDMNTVSNKTYNYVRNKPPFPSAYPRFVEMRNSQSTYLYNDGKEKYGDLYPDESTIVLKYGKQAPQRIFRATENGGELYHWCQSKSSFILSGRTKPLPFDIKNSFLYSIDANGDSYSEILAIDKEKSTLISLRSRNSESCTNDTSMLDLNILWTGSAEDSTVTLIADADNDGKEDWLSFNINNRNWNIKSFTDNNWREVSSGYFPEQFISSNSSQVFGKFVPGSKYAYLLIAGISENKKSINAFEYNYRSGDFIPAIGLNEHLLSDEIHPGDILIAVNTDDDNQSEILKQGRTWRFDMKLIDCDAKGFYVRSEIQFKNYLEPCNPKFYEIVKPITGKFISADNAKLLLLLRNCSDTNFSGSKCSEFEGNADLPDHLQMYDMKNPDRE